MRQKYKTITYETTLTKQQLKAIESNAPVVGFGGLCGGGKTKLIKDRSILSGLKKTESLALVVKPTYVEVKMLLDDYKDVKFAKVNDVDQYVLLPNGSRIYVDCALQGRHFDHLFIDPIDYIPADIFMGFRDMPEKITFTFNNVKDVNTSMLELILHTYKDVDLILSESN